jgi:hypothetical protein
MIPSQKHRIADQSDHSYDLVGPAILPDRAGHAHRYAHQHADQGRDGGQLERGREDPRDVLQHRPVGDQRLTEVTGDHLLDVDPELGRQRPIQPELAARGLVDILGCLIADHRQHRIDRHDPSDEEGDREQAQQRQRDLQQERRRLAQHGRTEASSLGRAPVDRRQPR